MILSEHLVDEFLKAMDDIGKYGLAKHGENSFHAHRLRGSYDRGESARLSAKGMAGHAQYHFDAYLAGTLHDHFGSLRHQLAGVAFNAMMEFYFAGLETERSDEIIRAVKGRAVKG